MASNIELEALFEEYRRENANTAETTIINDIKLRVLEVLNKIKEPMQEDYYRAAVIFQYGMTIKDFQLAHVLTGKAFNFNRLDNDKIMSPSPKNKDQPPENLSEKKQAKKDQPDENENSFKMTCANCGETGHFAAMCIIPKKP